MDTVWSTTKVSKSRPQCYWIGGNKDGVSSKPNQMFLWFKRNRTGAAPALKISYQYTFRTLLLFPFFFYSRYSLCSVLCGIPSGSLVSANLCQVNWLHWNEVLIHV